MINSEKIYVKSGYCIKWKDKGKVLYKCCCDQEDLPLDPKISWRNFLVGGSHYWIGNYSDYDLYYSIQKVRASKNK